MPVCDKCFEETQSQGGGTGVGSGRLLQSRVMAEGAADAPEEEAEQC